MLIAVFDHSWTPLRLYDLKLKDEKIFKQWLFRIYRFPLVPLQKFLYRRGWARALHMRLH